MKATRLLVASVSTLALLQLSGYGQAQPPALERAWRANNLGVARLEQYNYEEAARSFREALQIVPSLDAVHVNLAIALFYGGHAAQAAAEARVAADRLPASASAQYMVGLIAKAEDRLDDATAAFERVLTIDTTDPAARVQLGQIRLQQRRFTEALQLFQDALSAEPYNVTAAYNAALALTRGGRAEEGRQAMQRFEALRDSAYGITYSQTYLAQGRNAEAISSTGDEPGLVSAATPSVSFVDATASFFPPGVADTGAPGGVTLFDVDGDGDLDVVEAISSGVRLLRNNGNQLGDELSRAGLPVAGTAVGVIVGDYDNDTRPDLLVLRSIGPLLAHQTAGGGFEDRTAAAGLPRTGSPPRAAAFADVDHDGDLDIIIAGTGIILLRNNGNGTFADITAAAGFGGPFDRVVSIAPTDFDNRRDIDVLMTDAARGPLLFRNLRDGTFREIAAQAGLPSGGATVLAVGDVNKDGFPDFFIGREDAPGALAVSDGQARFQVRPAHDATRGATAAQWLDYDNDGLLDLMVASGGRLRLFRNVGAQRSVEVSDAARLSAWTQPAEAFALGDLDGDGDTDVIVRVQTGGLRFLRNEGGNRNRAARVRLTARVSNRSAVGTRVEMRSGSLRQTIETAAAFPPVGPADLLFGLGPRANADVLRVLWPSGILQAETTLGSPASRTTSITELDRKPSSCPYLFTWNGSRFEFVTDFMGGGEIGDWLAPGVWNQPDPDEYVRIRGDQLVPLDGRYELRVTNELEETLFVDRLQLVAVDHPSDVSVFPNEGLVSPPRPPFQLVTVRNAHPPVRATDEHGHDVLPQIASIDRRYPDDFAVRPIRGYAARHELTLDLGSASTEPVLLLTGWTDYAFSSDNVAASHAGIEMQLPSLEVRDQSGTWRTALGEIGFPVGRPQTVVVDLRGKFLSASREVRIVTSMRIYWDQILVAQPDADRVRVTRLEPARADLRWRGFSAEQTPDGREPFGYDYQRVSTNIPWKTLLGRYTREGDVRPLLRAVDDMFVISRPGDEIELSFDARSPTAVPAGFTRTFLLYVHGYSKEMNPRSATTDVLLPLPFQHMTQYPYGPTEHYPRTKAHRDYLTRYNTRVVNRLLPPLVSEGGAR